MPYQCDPCVCPEQHYRDSMSWRKAMITLLCRLVGYSDATINPGYNATFDPLTAVDAGSIGAAYASAVDLPDATRSIDIDNQTDGCVYVSMDGGLHDHYHLVRGQTMHVNLYDIGRVTTADIQLKDGITPASTGNVFIYSMR